jgi:hypothetical protein
MTQRFWLGTLSGCYVGHGETYKHPEDILWWAKGGVLHGESPQRIQWLKDLMAEAPPFHELQPLGDDQGRFLLAKPGEFYFDLIDPVGNDGNAGRHSPRRGLHRGSAEAGHGLSLHAYQPGEKLRPEARLTASVTEGRPPLTVKFASAGSGRRAGISVTARPLRKPNRRMFSSSPAFIP